MDFFDSIKIPFCFLAANVIILLAILWLNRYMESKQQSKQSSIKPIGQFSQGLMLQASEILGWEFEYARTTASEAMQDRYTMVNFYLIMVGVVASGVVVVWCWLDLFLENYSLAPSMA